MISVIIPLADDESHWQELIPLLDRLPENSEIILAINHRTKIDTSKFKDVKTVDSEAGRAQQMNAGAHATQNNWLWFLHADSRFDKGAIEKLIAITKENKKALYYHTLRFLDDGPKAIVWNERAVKWRSDFLKIPFGDQGFFVRKDMFLEVGGYREDLSHGEDHVFVWHIRQQGYPVLGTHTDMWTSARKYQRGGWGPVTLLHIWHTIKQGVPERLKLFKHQLKRTLS